jgi:hypothetical protein
MDSSPPRRVMALRVLQPIPDVSNRTKAAAGMRRVEGRVSVCLQRRGLHYQAAAERKDRKEGTESIATCVHHRLATLTRPGIQPKEDTEAALAYATDGSPPIRLRSDLREAASDGTDEVLSRGRSLTGPRTFSRQLTLRVSTDAQPVINYIERGYGPAVSRTHSPMTQA